MKNFLLVIAFLILGISLSAQKKSRHSSAEINNETRSDFIADSLIATLNTKSSTPGKNLIHKADSLTQSDYLMSIERVNENLNSIRDSAQLDFETVKLGRRIKEITSDIKLIRQNIREKRSAVNIKSIYLYQSFATSLDKDNTRIRARVATLYNRTYRAKRHLNNVLSDSVFKALITLKEIPDAFDKKLIRLNRKWVRTDSTVRANIDSLNALQVNTADNALNLSSMLSIMAKKLDRASPQLFGQETTNLWQLHNAFSPVNDTTTAIDIISSENKAIVYYLSQTTGKREFVLVFGIILFVWLFFKRKLLRLIREKKDVYHFIQLHYLKDQPVLSLLISLLCLMPLFDAYAPTSYTAGVYAIILIVASLIFFRDRRKSFYFYWLAFVVLFFADTLTYLLTEAIWIERMLMMSIHLVILGISIRFFRQLTVQTPFYKWIRTALVTGMILMVLAVTCNIFGRFSLSGIIGLAGIFAITQVMILPIFIETVIEIIILQLLSSRLKKGIDKPFDSAAVTNKVRKPLLWIAIIIWTVLLTSNLNIYNTISNMIVDSLTSPRSIGSITFEWVSVLMFFVIIWLAHVFQRLISFFFGETGSQIEDVSSISKGQHSRLLITRLLVLIGGYMLAIAASGLPIDKLTFLLGALGVGIGMGLQGIVNNFVSGIILIFDGSLQIGDEIEVNGQAGKVKEIGLRASTLYTSEGAEVTIPNGAILSQNIVNWTLSNDQKRLTIAFSLSGKELDANVVNEVINTTFNNIPEIISNRNPVILYTRVTPQTLSLTVRFWSTVSNVDQVKSEAMLRLSAAFSQKSIGFE